MKRIGFGQVEPNHLRMQRTGGIFAQLPAADTIDVLENGQFVKYDYENGVVNFTGKGQWLMVFNEVKLYDDLKQAYKDFAMKRTDYKMKPIVLSAATYGTAPSAGVMVPRCVTVELGDIFTTNCIKVANTSGDAVVDMGTVAKGNILVPNANTGYLEVKSVPAATDMQFLVVKVYTMPDGQEGVKLQRIN